MSDPADLGVVEAAGLLAERKLSSVELVQACLARIRQRDGVHSHEGDSASINAWVRVYEEDALAAAAQADEQRGAGPEDTVPYLCGIPIGLKDLYAVAGKPLTASSRLLDEVPERDCDVWALLAANGMVLLGHLHTHEFAVGGTTDQVGNPWALDRSAGGSSGGSAAALAARMVPVATGTDTAGSLRIPSAICSTSTIKPTRGLVSMAGVVPLARSLDHAGPMARSLADCAPLWSQLTGPGATDRFRHPAERQIRRGDTRLDGVRLAVSPRVGRVDLDPDVAEGFETALAACRSLGAELIEAPASDLELDVGDDFLDVLCAELIVYHRRFDDRRELYRPSLREWMELSEQRATSAEAYVAAQTRRRELQAAWVDWFETHRIAALIEPTVPVVAPLRGNGYDHARSDVVLLLLTHYWDWTGFPAAALPAGVGSRSGLPVGVSFIGSAGTDWELLSLGIALQAELGIPAPPGF